MQRCVCGKEINGSSACGYICECGKKWWWDFTQNTFVLNKKYGICEDCGKNDCTVCNMDER